MLEEDRLKKTEFDFLADNYKEYIALATELTGESAEFFAEYKIADLFDLTNSLASKIDNIFDFGSGIGNSIPFFRRYFFNSNVTCAEISARSSEIAISRFPGNEQHLTITDQIPIESNSQDLVFTACVFHHIPENEHEYWLSELFRILMPGGLLVIYEHNPLNPLTVRAVKNSPLDVNAKLIKADTMLKKMVSAEFTQCQIRYKLFFPKFLAKLRFIEPWLGRVFLGAQYRCIGKKPISLH